MLNEREVKHLDRDDNEEMQEGETVMAFWSADKEFYEAAIIKISGECLIKKQVRSWECERMDENLQPVYHMFPGSPRYNTRVLKICKNWKFLINDYHNIYI